MAKTSKKFLGMTVTKTTDKSISNKTKQAQKIGKKKKLSSALRANLLRRKKPE